MALDFDTIPPLTRRWWVAGQIVLAPGIMGVKRLSVRGKEHLPESGPTLVVSNHVSQLDPPTMGLAALPRKSYYMAKSELFRIPLYRRIIWRAGAFPVERGGADRRALRLAREVLRRGDLLVMFPEGTRNPEGRLRAPFAGAGALGLEPGVTVVPAAIWGSQKRLRKVRVVYGPPIDLSDLTEGPRSRRAQVAVERMMAAVAELLPQAGGPVQPPTASRDPAKAPPEVLDG
ncbi:MAG TPA: lysophospholipid acyltransferase family protein [Miltoncostaeaceae bacterium]|nr:lysophospholipid acyltransferase family protein [Miltoncostaeaceae bacterium]